MAVTEIIYEPKGKAREYCDLAANIYKGCDHGCRYCYAPAALRMAKETFAHARVRVGVLENLAIQAPQYRGREVLLCFTCDPYQHQDQERQHTREAIKILHQSGVRVVVLTKGGKRSRRDFDLLEAKPNLSKYGATLTFTPSNLSQSLEWEPNAASPKERFDILQEAHARGIETWASLEPVIDPTQTIEIINLAKGFVDTFKVGRWNHDVRASKIDWTKFGRDAVELLHKLGKQYYIKNDLLLTLDERTCKIYNKNLEEQAKIRGR